MSQGKLTKDDLHPTLKQIIDNAGAVKSVNGKTGEVVIGEISEVEREKWNKALQPNLFADTFIENLGDNVARRVFPPVIWKHTNSELWESVLYISESIWGILELDIAGYSASSGGAKVIIDLGINKPLDGSPLTVFRNEVNVIFASPGFTNNIFIECEIRPASSGVYLKIYKKTYNDPLMVSATLTKTNGVAKAINFLANFTDGVLYNDVTPTNMTLQKGYNVRIDELFQSASDVKTNVSQAIRDKGGSANATDTGLQLANAIRAIPTGKKTAQGSGTVSSNTMSANVGFQPEVVHIRGNGFVGDFIFDSLLESPTSAIGVILSGGVWLRVTANVTRTTTGFSMTVQGAVVSGNFTYIAYG